MMSSGAPNKEVNMTPPFTTLDQFHGFLETLRLEIERIQGYDELTASTLDAALGWLVEKQNNFTGEAYLDQIEKNAVYFYELASICNLDSSKYLFLGQPILTAEEVEPFVSLRRGIALQIADQQVRFIRYSCSGCDMHDEHSLWADYQRMRNMGDRRVYVEELEFACIRNRVFFMTSEYFLSTLLLNHKWAGIASRLPVQGVIDEVIQEVHVQATEWSGELIYSVSQQIGYTDGKIYSKPPSSTKPTWRDIWGRRFDEITRSKGMGTPRPSAQR